MQTEQTKRQLPITAWIYPTYSGEPRLSQYCVVEFEEEEE